MSKDCDAMVAKVDELNAVLARKDQELADLRQRLQEAGRSDAADRLNALPKDLKSRSNVVEANIKAAYNSIYDFDEECNEFHGDLQAVLAETRTRIDDVERGVRELQASTTSKV